MRDFAQLVESHGCVNEIAQNDLAGLNITGEKVFDALAQKRLAKTGITLNARLDRFRGDLRGGSSSDSSESTTGA